MESARKSGVESGLAAGDLVLGLAEDDADEAGLGAEVLEGVAVVDLIGAPAPTLRAILRNRPCRSAPFKLVAALTG